jgi:tetratricopeptide (TPR) repeat protein
MAKRHLAAIMFTDIVGYDSLLKEDEKKAFEILRKNQRIHKRLIKKFNGRWLKEMESGVLASFSSVIDVVMCALAIQKATEELGIPIRIGIHQGEVIFERYDVLGDGVNIASRIHNKIDTHGIVISDTVYKDIKNKEGLEIESLGTQALKGVDSPVGIYKVSCHDEKVLDFTIDTGELVRPLSFKRSSIIIGIIVIALTAYVIYYFSPKTTSLSEISKKILILPPENYLGTDTLDYLIAAMHDALIGDMGKIGALSVISRTSAVAYKKEGKSVLEMASEYNIDYVVEPSALCYGDSICTQYKMFDDQENELLVQDISVEKSQFLNLFRGIAKKIAEEINVDLNPEQENSLAETRMVDDDALELYMKGRFYIEQMMSKEALEKAEQYLKRSIDKDPTWASPYAALAEVGLYQRQFGFIQQSKLNPIINDNIGKALELDPDNVTAHFVNAMTASTIEWNWEKSEREYKKALELNPNHAMTHVFYAHLLGSLQRTEEIVYHAKKAVELDPSNPLLLGLSAVALNGVGESQAALAQAENALSIEPNLWFTDAVLAEIYWETGDTVKWFEVKRKLFLWTDEKVLASIDSAFFEYGFIGVAKQRIKAHEEMYRKSGVPYFWTLADWYMKVENYEKAMDYYEKAYENHTPGMCYIGGKGIYDKLKDNSRYIALLKKMNLPLN